MRRSEGVALRIDDAMRQAIRDMGARLGTENVSQIIRTGFMLGYEKVADIPTAISKRAFREGVIAGAAEVKAQIDRAIHDALEENPNL